MLRNYLIVAVRNLLRHKGYSAINIFGLAVGMACFITILLYVQYELSFDTFHEKADRIFKLVEIHTYKGRSPEHVGVTQGPMGPAMLEGYPEVVGYTRFWNANSPQVQYGEKKVQIENAYYVDPAFLKIFSFEIVSGNPETALNEPGSVVLTEQIANQFFKAGEDPVGKVLHLMDRDHTVMGIIKDVPKNSSIQFGMLISSETLRGGQQPVGGKWDHNWLTTFLLLSEGADYKVLEAKFPRFVQKYLPDAVDYFALYLHPLKKVHLYSTQINFDEANWNRSDVTYVYIFSLTAVFVLFIACINFMNLTTARSGNRAREVGMRKVVGANRRQLISQFCGEAVLLAFLSLVLAVCLAELFVPLFNNLSGLKLELRLIDRPLFVLGIIGITAFVGVFSGSYPALYLSSLQPVWILKGKEQSSVKGIGLRKLLVVVQFSISIFLIIGTGLVAKQFKFMRFKNMGFNKSQVVSFRINQEMQKGLESLKSELMQNPAIVGVTASERRLGQSMSETTFDFEGRSPDQSWLFSFLWLDYDFIPFYELELVEGRNFSREFMADAFNSRQNSAYIVNETLVKKIGWKSAVGKKFRFNEKQVEWGTVIGVVKDFNYYSLHHKIEPLVLCVRPNRLWYLSVRVKTGRADEALSFLRKKAEKWYPDTPFTYEFLDERFAQFYESEERMGKIFGVSSVLAILIACLGLFGLASYTAEQRTKEIGIRKVLGASVSDIVMLLSREFVYLVLISNLIAWPIAYYAMRRWLQDFAYRIELGPGVFIVGGVLALVIALMTVSAQAVKAARANPIDALRYE